VQFSGGPHFGFVEMDGRTASKPTTRASGGETCFRSFLNQPTLKLCQRGEDVEDQLSRRAGCVDEATLTDRKPMPRLRRSSINTTNWCIERPRRSSRQTTSVSPCCNLARQAPRPGRSVFARETLSVKMSSWVTPQADERVPSGERDPGRPWSRAHSRPSDRWEQA
jgi:hypothetical protein